MRQHYIHSGKDHRDILLGVKLRYRKEYKVTIIVEENINISEIYILSLEGVISVWHSSEGKCMAGEKSRQNLFLYTILLLLNLVPGTFLFSYKK